jgi:hypothetical protein
MVGCYQPMYLPGMCAGIRINGHGKMRSMPGGHGYESSSMLSSDLETTSFLESEDDASSHITTTTGRATNLSIDRMGESWSIQGILLCSFIDFSHFVLLFLLKNFNFLNLNSYTAKCYDNVHHRGERS